MRFGTDENQVAEIQWQFAQPGALPLPFPTPFVSRDWIHWEMWPAVGEVQYAPRLNTPDVGLSPMRGTGRPCGDPAVWAAGYPGTVPAAYPRGVFGQLLCCLPPMGQADFGLLPYPSLLPTPSATSRRGELLWDTVGDGVEQLLPARRGAWWLARALQWVPRKIQMESIETEELPAPPRTVNAWWPAARPATWTPAPSRPIEATADDVETLRGAQTPIISAMPRWPLAVSPPSSAVPRQLPLLPLPGLAAVLSGGGGGWPAQVYVEMPGTADNNCNCQPFRDGVYLDLFDDDPEYPEWRLVDPLGGGGACQGTLRFFRTFVDQWSLSFSGPVTWVVTMGAWDGVTPVTLTRTSGADQFQCTSYPLEVTVHPV